MELLDQEQLADELRLAVAYTPAKARARMAVFLAFDQRLARIIAQTSEPMLAQIRLAWWRDTLALAVEQRPTGDAVLDAIGEHWNHDVDALIGLAEGWEEMLAEPPISKAALDRFAGARAAPFVTLAARDLGANDNRRVNQAARIWALADVALNTTDEQERGFVIAEASSGGGVGDALPTELRGLAVLRALALRSLRGGGAPLMEGRGAAWVALRAGIAGR